MSGEDHGKRRLTTTVASERLKVRFIVAVDEERPGSYRAYMLSAEPAEAMSRARGLMAQGPTPDLATSKLWKKYTNALSEKVIYGVA